MKYKQWKAASSCLKFAIKVPTKANSNNCATGVENILLRQMLNKFCPKQRPENLVLKPKYENFERIARKAGWSEIDVQKKYAKCYKNFNKMGFTTKDVQLILWLFLNNHETFWSQ